MSVPVMVDSSWYVAAARAGRDPLRALAFTAESRDIATCGVIQMEVGRGLRDQTVLDRMRAAWATMLYVPSDAARWEKTLDLERWLRDQGVWLPLVVAHIATCALSIGAVVLTEDRHFSEIPGLAATNRIY